MDYENDRYDEIAKYEPITNSDIEYFLVPEKLEQKIYGYDIYKFEVRNHLVLRNGTVENDHD